MRAPLMPSLFPRNDKSERKVGRKSFPRPILRRFCARVQRKSIMSQCRKANLLETRGKKGRRGRVSTVNIHETYHRLAYLSIRVRSRWPSYAIIGWSRTDYRGWSENRG